ncbi:unnamed protein product [Lampetra fluviatilis]
MLIDNYDEEDADSPEQRPKKRGRKTADVWELFTEASQPHKAKSNMCKHCKTLINYHKKIESVKVHLNKCSPFQNLMNGMEDADRPDWYKRNAIH